MNRPDQPDRLLRDRISNWTLGVAGESGELVDLIKKHLHHDRPLEREKVVKEMGDVCWYVAALAYDLAIPFSTVLKENIEKLRRRYPDGFSVEASRNRADV